ncbi:MAG TPA: hypothetical protein VF590_24805 [Isosphaeraceae bacterium]
MLANSTDGAVTRLEFAYAMAGVSTNILLVFAAATATTQPWMRLLVLVMAGGMAIYHWSRIASLGKTSREGRSGPLG